MKMVTLGFRLSLAATVVSASPGFFDWHEQIEVGDAAAQKIQVKLTVEVVRGMRDRRS